MAFKYTKAQMDRLKTILRQAEEDHAFLDELASAQRDSFDEKSDKWKEGDKATEAEEWISHLETMRDNMETLKDSVEEVEGIAD